MKIHQLPALSDNYIFLIESDEEAYVIDPAEAKPVLDALSGRTLKKIFITHHHVDHIGGVEELKEKTGAIVIGPDDDRVPALDQRVKEGDSVEMGNSLLEVIEVPGHTSSHIAYFAPKERWLFCGDSLFTAGCGRLFEGTPEEMYHSLQKLSKLPEDTLVHCGHEYTVKNLEFALSIQPMNRTVEYRLNKSKELQAQGEPTVPAPLSTELMTNPFLRVHLPNLKKDLSMEDASDIEVFAHIRSLRNQF